MALRVENVPPPVATDADPRLIQEALEMIRGLPVSRTLKNAMTGSLMENPVAFGNMIDSVMRPATDERLAKVYMDAFHYYELTGDELAQVVPLEAFVNNAMGVANTSAASAELFRVQKHTLNNQDPATGVRIDMSMSDAQHFIDEVVNSPVWTGLVPTDPAEYAAMGVTSVALILGMTPELPMMSLVRGLTMEMMVAVSDYIDTVDGAEDRPTLYTPIVDAMVRLRLTEKYCETYNLMRAIIEAEKVRVRTEYATDRELSSVRAANAAELEQIRATHAAQVEELRAMSVRRAVELRDECSREAERITQEHQDAMEQFADQHQAAMQQLADQHASEMEQMQNELQGIEQELQAEQMAQDDGSGLMQRLAQVEAQNASLTRDLEAATLDFRTQEETLGRAMTELETLRAASAAPVSSDALEAAQAEVARLQAANQELSDSIRRLEATNESLWAPRQTTSDAEVQALQQSVARLEAELRSTTSQVEQLTAANTELTERSDHVAYMLDLASQYEALVPEVLMNQLILPGRPYITKSKRSGRVTETVPTDLILDFTRDGQSGREARIAAIVRLSIARSYMEGRTDVGQEVVQLKAVAAPAAPKPSHADRRAMQQVLNQIANLRSKRHGVYVMGVTDFATIAASFPGANIVDTRNLTGAQVVALKQDKSLTHVVTNSYWWVTAIPANVIRIIVVTGTNDEPQKIPNGWVTAGYEYTVGGEMYTTS